MRHYSSYVTVVCLAVLAVACSDKKKERCAEGAEGCECTAGAGCDPGLVCFSRLCVRPAKCGNGTVEETEACDDGDTISNGDGACVADCSTIQTCGNGTPEGTETCDDGSGESEGLCLDDCSGIQSCGNSIPEGTEACDDGNTVTETECLYGTASCTVCDQTCQNTLNRVGNVCGDGDPDVTNETCDDGDGILSDDCPDGSGGTCQTATCGDGFVQTGVDECDGNAVANGYCAGDCTITCNTDFDNCNGNAVDGCEADLNNDATTCGSCSNACVQDWTCNRGNCILQLAADQDAPNALVAGATHVYWTNWGTRDSLNNYNFDGSVVKVPLDGGAIVTLADSQDKPQDVAIDATDVFWINSGDWGSANGAIMKVPKAGGTPVSLAGSLGQPRSLAIDDTYAYWIEPGASGGGNGKIMQVPKDGSSSPSVLVSSQQQPQNLAIDADNVYWMHSYQEIRKVAKVGGSPSTLTTSAWYAERLIVHGTFLYWIVGDFGGLVRKMSVDGGSVTTLANEPEPSGINGWGWGGTAVDGSNVYWFLGASAGNVRWETTILKTPTAPGPTEILVALSSDQNIWPSAIDVDGSSVYWVIRGAWDASAGMIMKAVK